ncbi:hypothetical protein [Burkholderia pseudomallei]|uniref:hypothetical protein n=1 Tax=Burkholderia pseudomallei TaxID=28450 RepID=UPI0005322417|nr:hypothetical protein [Burkholderia pseudomallei]KGR99711.1 hypothetical protein X977_4924 [Burkholderia pseudomallei MSHR7504]
MNFSTHTALLAALMVALVAMFALGFYWLAAKRRSTGAHSPIAPPPVRGATLQRSAFDISELDEWEALAHYPDHVLHATQEASAEPQDFHSPYGRPDEATPEPFTPNIRRDLHEAIEPLMNAAAKLEPAPGQASAKTGPSPSEPVLRCPRCLSSRIDTRNRARKAGSAIGSVAGATGGMAAALAGAETGAVVGSIAGPIGTVFGGLAGAVIAGLVGSAAGCAAGSAVGSAVDDNLLDNYQCLACTHSFSVKQAV